MHTTNPTTSTASRFGRIVILITICSAGIAATTEEEANPEAVKMTEGLETEDELTIQFDQLAFDLRRGQISPNEYQEAMSRLFVRKNEDSAPWESPLLPADIAIPDTAASSDNPALIQGTGSRESEALRELSAEIESQFNSIWAMTEDADQYQIRIQAWSEREGQFSLAQHESLWVQANGLNAIPQPIILVAGDDAGTARLAALDIEEEIARTLLSIQVATIAQGADAYQQAVEAAQTTLEPLEQELRVLWKSEEERCLQLSMENQGQIEPSDQQALIDEAE